MFGGTWGNTSLAGAYDLVTLDDSQSTVAHTYAINTGTGNALSRDGNSAFYVSTHVLNLAAGRGDDTIVLAADLVNFTGQSRRVTVDGGDGNDTFRMGGIDNGPSWGTSSLGGFNAGDNITLHGGVGSNTLIANDSSGLARQTYSISYNARNPFRPELILGSYGGTIARTSGMSRVELQTAKTVIDGFATGNTVNVSHLPVGTRLALKTMDRDTVNLGSYWDPSYDIVTPYYWGQRMDGIQGTVAISSTGLGPKVTITDSGAIASRNLVLDGTAKAYTLSGFGTGAVQFLGFTPGRVDVLTPMWQSKLTTTARTTGIWTEYFSWFQGFGIRAI